MERYLDYQKVAPGALKAMLGVEGYVRGSGLDPALLELVRIRVSQIHGCAFCLDMHSREARAAGETEQRLHVLAGWREANLYTDAERAGLALAEAVTLLATREISDEVYRQAREHFGDKGCVDLVMAIIAINSWNRLAVTFHTPIAAAAG
ncbi:MAG TPA: carboxymuconolactone decarboxylase family protein [Lysobacter sp.]|nr:carboxymuconolactone decarboxylase family protein [Lysobacter sp.]